MVLLRCFVILLLLSSCSRLHTGYKLAPRLIANKLDDSFDFNSKRYDTVKKTIETDLAENKKNMIEEIIGFIDRVQPAVSGPEISENDSQALISNYKNVLKKITLSFKNSFGLVILNLESDEKKNILEHFKKKISEKSKLLSQKNKFSDKITTSRIQTLN